MSKANWKKDLEQATIFKYYDKNDVVPYEIVRRSKYKQILQDLILKRFRIYIVFVLDKIAFSELISKWSL